MMACVLHYLPSRQRREHLLNGEAFCTTKRIGGGLRMFARVLDGGMPLAPPS